MYEVSSSETSSSEDLSLPVTSTTTLPPSHDDSSVSTDSANEQADDPQVIHARAYQREMFEESLKQNIIVAMDTGSGKTQVAVLRIQAELEKSSADKIVWFLVPTVALCDQQSQVLKSQIPAVQIKVLSGAYNCDTWSEQRIWDDYLRDVRIVVSTYQILFDAVSHAFIRLSRLSLIVLDEAHNCTKNHPGSKLMDLYRREKAAGLPIPWILGLTASPVMRSDPDAIDVIESTLDAVCKSPSVHRAELMETVKRPVLSCVLYSPSENSLFTKSMDSLVAVFHSLNIYEDPYIIRLHSQNTEKSMAQLRKALDKRDTFVFRQFKALCHRSKEIQVELGSWAADYFIYTALRWYLDSVSKNDSWFETWQNEEKQYLARALRRVTLVTPLPVEHDMANISNKVVVLVRELMSSPDGTIGIVFVRETATVAILTHLLSNYPSIKDRFRIGSMIGTSNYAFRKRDLGEIINVKGTISLDEFRAGRLNLLIGTNVLEEGIDIPACNLVVCFDKPQNLKSFIQRRGRARMKESRFILLLDGVSNKHSEWTALEEEMRKRYEDDTRQLQELVELEESERHPNMKPLYIPQTSAQLDFDQAKSHLEHFCNVVASRQYIDPRPYYLTEEVGTSEDGQPQIRATVVLPTSLPPHVRRVTGSGLWFSEKNACKDAAFQAFLGLYKAGLVNDHLMPLIDDILEGIETRSSMVDVAQPWNPWQHIAHAWGKATELHQRKLRLKDGKKVIGEYHLSLPCYFPTLPPFKIYWDRANTWTVEIGEVNVISAHDVGADQSAALVDLANGHRFPIDNSGLILHIRSTEEILFQQHVGQQPIEKDTLDCNVLVRENPRTPYFFQEWLPSRPSLESVQVVPLKHLEEPVDVPWLAVRKWPRRRDFLQALHNEPSIAPSDKPYQTIRPAHHFRKDGIDVSKAYFGALIPSITHMIEIYLKAQALCDTVLKDIGFSDLSLVVTAISASAAHESTNYQRFEFLGDSILKLLATLSVTANSPPHEPEGYLSARKDRVVSNSRLYRSAVHAGLDKYILTKQFNGSKWRPLYIKDLLQIDPESTTEKRNLSTKTMADVVESLIGAAHQDGGMAKALKCVRHFIPELEWHSPDDARAILFNQRALGDHLPAMLRPLEELIGYTFRDKGLLVEAVTHASYDLSRTAESCMERLEFVGDAVLDSVVVSELWCGRELPHQQMHLLRAATTNADLLGLMAMEWSAARAVTDIRADGSAATAPAPLPLWAFMRHVSPAVGEAQRGAAARHAAGRGAALEALRGGREFPWALLARLRIPKFVSDLFESLLGAVYIDSADAGDADACRRFVERAGVLPCLRRLLADGVDARHPKNRLGELLGHRKVRYEIGARERGEGDGGEDGYGDGDGDGGGGGVGGNKKEFFCRVFVDEKLVVEVGAGVGREEVVTRAADVAYQRRGEWMDTQ